MKATTYGARLRKLFDVKIMVESSRPENEIVIYFNAPDGTHSRVLMTPDEARKLAKKLNDGADWLENENA